MKKGKKKAPESALLISDKAKTSMEYGLACQAARQSIDSVWTSKNQISAEIDCSEKQVMGRDPDNPDRDTVCGVCHTASFTVKHGKWSDRFKAITRFMNNLEKLCGREAYISQMRCIDYSAMQVEVDFRLSSAVASSVAADILEKIMPASK